MLQEHIRNPSENIWKRGISEKCLQMKNNQEGSGFCLFRDREAPESDNKSENRIQWICKV